MEKQKRKRKTKPLTPPNRQCQVATPLKHIKDAYIKAEGLLSMAAESLQMSIRLFKYYIYDYYREEMEEVIEMVIEKRADKVMRISNKILSTVERKTDLTLEILNQNHEERKAEDFALLPLFTIKEQQFLIFILQLYAKHRGFSLIYNAQDFTVDATQEGILSEEERQVFGSAIKEVARHNPEIIGQLRVIQGGKT